MHLSSSSSSPSIANSEVSKGGVKRDAGSGGTIPVNGTAVYPDTPISSVPSFAAIVSSSSPSGKTNSPFSSSTKTPSSTFLRQKHPQPSSSSGPTPPLGDNSNDNKNNFINSTSFTTGNGIAINTSAQSTIASSSSAASPPSFRRNTSESDTAIDNSNDDVENDQEDSESSDVEIYLNSFDSDNSTTRMNVLSGTNSAYSPGATSTQGNQMPISAFLHPQSPFHLPTQTKTGYTPITEDQGTCGRVMDQEKRGPDQVSVLGTYGNYIDANTFTQASVSSTSNDRTDNSSNLAPSFVNNWSQGVFAHGHANHPISTLSGSSGDPPLPEMKGAIQTTAASLGDDSEIPQSTRMPNPSSSITIDLASLSVNGNRLGGGASLNLSTANAGTSHQGQMGMIVSGSQHAVNTARESSKTPYATLNGIFTSSASDPTFCGLADGSESVGSSSENGTALSASCASVVRTPNVYINGLAPHFPEDELFNLCNEFGPIRSVRTFTRHAKDTESGYGFVLFESIDDAEKCINEIRRRYKNLHPTFSKQIHKIPGTNYAAGPSTSWNVSVTEDDVGANGSFKARMESLHDPTSTNLYMEGLPLSIDEPTLSALVSPHQIVSSRFFQTRLSDPPKIIAFVRLETRAGAEEIIERLHGRMVRGWNDTGSRITVRFADTSKQRDLRKERAAQETDTSPSRLTIAQASLLNLRGQDLRPSVKPVQPTHTGNTLSLPSSSSSRGFATSVSAPDFSSNSSYANHGPSNFNLPVIGNGLGRTTPGPTVGGGQGVASDYSHAYEGRGVVHPRSVSPYAREYLQSQVDQQHGMSGQHAIGRFYPGRESMLDSRADASVPRVDPRRGHEDMSFNEEMEENFYSQNSGIRFPRHQGHSLPYGQHHLPVSQSMDGMLGQTYSRPSPVYTRSGYTPAEEYLMRTHAENAALTQVQRLQPNHVNMMPYQPQRVERGRPAPLALGRPAVNDAEPAGNIGVGMRAYRAQASLMSPTVSTSTSANSLSSFGSTGELKMGDGGFGLSPSSGIMTEEDFHAGETTHSATLMTLRNLHASRLSRELRSYQVGQKSAGLSPFLPVSSSTMSQNQDHSTPSPSLSAEVSMISPNPNDTILSAYQQQSANAHMRSTTLPQHRPSTITNGHIRGHHQHSSMSIPKQNLGTPQHASVARLGGSSSLVEDSSGTIYECDAPDKFQAEVGGGRLGSSNNGAHHGNVGSSLPLKTHYSSSSIFGDTEQSSPLSASSSLISPTLTYASRTPSTLSPPTPFFGSFNSNMEGFDKIGAGDHAHGQKEIHGGNASRSD